MSEVPGCTYACVVATACSGLLADNSVEALRSQVIPAPAGFPKSRAASPAVMVPQCTAPFAGLWICVTGGVNEEKAAWADLVKANGGRYSGDLTKSCTHLVIKRKLGPHTPSPKEKQAHDFRSSERHSYFTADTTR